MTHQSWLQFEFWNELLGIHNTRSNDRTSDISELNNRIDEMNAKFADLEQKFDALQKKYDLILETRSSDNRNSNHDINDKNNCSSKSATTCDWCLSSKSDINDWCKVCDTKDLVDHFSDWSSGDHEVDELIRSTQRKATSKFNFLEWIPKENLRNVKLIGKGGFGKVYSAIWIDGPRSKWVSETKEWKRYGGVKVALKCLLGDKPNKELFDEMIFHLDINKNILGRNNTLRIFGITENPSTPGQYMMVMILGDNGDLRSYIKNNFADLDYQQKLEILFDMITGILQIHKAKFVHRDLHPRNIMCQQFIKQSEGRNDFRFVVGDLGLTRRIVKPEYLHGIGVVEYCAPEVLEKNKFSEASDIYSFGIIMWELVVGIKPFLDYSNNDLILAIIMGRTPPLTMHIDGESKTKVHFPPSYKALMEQCWNRDPKKRPPAQLIYETIGVWLQNLMFAREKSIAQEFVEADEKRLLKIPIKVIVPEERSGKKPSGEIEEGYESHDSGNDISKYTNRSDLLSSSDHENSMRVSSIITKLP
ncbi:6399_t:CDS:2 [Acaulospora morrowiae]|uniref:6399_t:CDS:1 n=1 Tax=Acaulospora morrowiae TaxID=94023 RepID=A0A9N9CBP5_9GLOM|nr:6399_t:CDS:2 [Acaulospora morrowiae]